MSDIDRQLEELKEAASISADTEELYQMIRRDIMSELVYQDLSIVRILRILLDVWQRDRTSFSVMLQFMANPLSSIREIARRLRTSPSSIHRRIRTISAGNPELALLLELRKEVTETKKHDDQK